MQECRILDGKALAQEVRNEIKSEVSKLTGRQPCLAVVLAGEDPASRVYVSAKVKACEEVGILSRRHDLPPTVTQAELLALVDQLNEDDTVDGILVQLPLPGDLDEGAVMLRIDPSKDVDGLHPVNVGKMLLGEPDGFLACTPLGIHTLLMRSGIETAGKNVVIVGRSNIVGKPMAAILMQNAPGCNATVTVAHRKTQNLNELCRSADILITALGVPRAITTEMVKPGAVLIDVGVNRVEDSSQSKGYRLVGDVDFDGVKGQCGAITPVPGGVGPMTIAMLLKNTVKSYLMRETLS